MIGQNWKGPTLTHIHELGVDEAYRLLTDKLGVEGLPPLDAIENEDWGRDLILSRLMEMPADVLERLGIAPFTPHPSVASRPHPRDGVGEKPE